MPTVGFLAPFEPGAPGHVLFLEGMRQLGYVDGQTLRFEGRFGRGHLARLPELAEELIKLRVDVIVGT